MPPSNVLVFFHEVVNTGQPGPTPEMKVPKGGNRNALNKPVNSQRDRDWSYGLFSCFDDSRTCCYSFWCPCFQYGRNNSRLRYLERNGAPHPSGGDSVGLECCCFFYLVGLHWILEVSSVPDGHTLFGRAVT